jgi:exopolyphosphatase/guanosine-5'-triphosphate,3'-diphosphate pyrophosphatase
LRLAELGDSIKAISEAAERAFAPATVLRSAPGKDLYLVGGASRAIARLHMEHTHYPLHIVHQYTIGRREAEGFFDIIGRQSRKSLERITTIARKRLELVPSAALILRKLIAIAAPQRVIFSAFGLREGYAYGLIPASERQPDPLIAVCALIARSQSRFNLNGDLLQQWTAPLFPGQSAGTRRIHRAACWLSDIAWSEHPDYRAEQAFTRSLRMPFAGICHAERVFLSAVLHTRSVSHFVLPTLYAAGRSIFCPRCDSPARATNWCSRSRRRITSFSAKRCSVALMPSPDLWE